MRRLQYFDKVEEKGSYQGKVVTLSKIDFILI